MADTHESTLAMLRRERDRIDSAIALIEAVQAAGGSFARKIVAGARVATTVPAARKHRGGSKPALDHDAIQRAYEAGGSCRAIAERHGCHEYYVRCLANRKGWRRGITLATPLLDRAAAH